MVENLLSGELSECLSEKWIFYLTYTRDQKHKFLASHPSVMFYSTSPLQPILESMSRCFFFISILPRFSTYITLQMTVRFRKWIYTTVIFNLNLFVFLSILGEWCENMFCNYRDIYWILNPLLIRFHFTNFIIFLLLKSILS